MRAIIGWAPGFLRRCERMCKCIRGVKWVNVRQHLSICSRTLGSNSSICRWAARRLYRRLSCRYLACTYVCVALLMLCVCISDHSSIFIAYEIVIEKHLDLIEKKIALNIEDTCAHLSVKSGRPGE